MLARDALTNYLFFCFISYNNFYNTYKRKSGCDEQDYSNACYAHSAGVSVAFEGKCSGEEEEDTTEPIFKCRHNDQCGEDEFCLLDVGMCDRKSVSGVCSSIDEMCTFEHNPVW